MAFYERIFEFRRQFCTLHRPLTSRTSCLVPFADMSRTPGKTEMALMQRSFSYSAKTSAICKEKNLQSDVAAVVYQYTLPASKIQCQKAA